MKILVDASHRNNKYDFGASGNGLKESALALAIAKKVKSALEKHNFVVYMTRETEDDIITLEQRTTKANNLNVDLYLSIHCNAFNKEAKGIEVLYYDDSRLAEDICNRMCSNTGAVNRGAKQRQDLHVLKATKMHAVLVECGFIDNVEEGKLLADTSYQDKLVKGIVDAVVAKYKIVVCAPMTMSMQNFEASGTSILSPTTATVEQCKEWARSKNATEVFIDNADIYFEICQQLGINPVMAYAQYAKETGYGRFGGVLDESYCNPCGLKITQGGGCTDPNAHKRFNSWNDGISAHVDHLALYAGVSGYPNPNTLDPRHFPYLLGKCRTVESLSGNWAVSQNYGTDLVRMMNEITSTVVLIVDMYKEAVTLLYTEGVIASPEAWEDKEKINVQFVPGLIGKMADYIRNS